MFVPHLRQFVWVICVIASFLLVFKAIEHLLPENISYSASYSVAATEQKVYDLPHESHMLCPTNVLCQLKIYGSRIGTTLRQKHHRKRCRPLRCQKGYCASFARCSSIKRNRQRCILWLKRRIVGLQ